MAAPSPALTKLGGADRGPDVAGVNQATEEGLDGVGRQVGLQRQEQEVQVMSGSQMEGQCRSGRHQTQLPGSAGQGGQQQAGEAGSYAGAVNRPFVAHIVPDVLHALRNTPLELASLYGKK